MRSAVDPWVCLPGSPLPWLALAVRTSLPASGVPARLGRSPPANPVLSSTAVLPVVLWLLDVPCERFVTWARFVHLRLGPAAVAIVVPLGH